jgi:hypothetical protein
MNVQKYAIGLALSLLLISGAPAQTRKPLTNADIVNMTKQGFDPTLIVKAIETSQPDFDVSAQTLMELKTAGVAESVMEAMLSAQAAQPSGAIEAAHGATTAPADGATAETSKHGCNPQSGCLLKESTQVPLTFANDLTSKTANIGDPVEMVLDEDLKVGDSVVVRKGAHALATVSDAKKAGMLGKGGELSVQLQYLVAGDNHVRVRGTKGREGENKTGATVALTVLFGPIGLIKHGKNVDIPPGTALQAYVDQDIWLPPVN